MLIRDALRGSVIPVFSISFTEVIQHLSTRKELLDLSTNRPSISLTATAKMMLSYRQTTSNNSWNLTFKGF
jgi:hypothetical protein